MENLPKVKPVNTTYLASVLEAFTELFHDGGPCLIEASTLICRAISGLVSI